MSLFIFCPLNRLHFLLRISMYRSTVLQAPLGPHLEIPEPCFRQSQNPAPSLSSLAFGACWWSRSRTESRTRVRVYKIFYFLSNQHLSLRHAHEDVATVNRKTGWGGTLWISCETEHVDSWPRREASHPFPTTPIAKDFPIPRYHLRDSFPIAKRKPVHSFTEIYEIRDPKLIN